MSVVSVLMTTLNSEKFLAEAINSILNQSFQDFELLIVDGGSNDKSIEIIKSFKDDRIRLFEYQGFRRSAQLNFGIKKSRGQYIAIMDSDDVALSDRLKLQIEYLEENKNISILGSWAYLISESGIVLSVLRRPKSNKAIKKNIVAMNGISFPTCMWRRVNETNQIYFNENLKVTEDIEWFLRVLPNSYFSNIPVPLMKLRQTRNSRSRSGIIIDNDLINSLENILNERIGTTKQRYKKSIQMRNLGVAHYYFGNMKKAKKVLIKSMFINPFSLLSLRYYVPLMLPEKLLLCLRRNKFLRKAALSFRNLITWQNIISSKKL